MAYNFQLPIITELTPDQQTVLNYAGPVAVSGGPGTGKSVIGLWRHIRNYDTGSKKSLLVTYTKSLERFLKETCRTINTDASDNVDRTYRWSNNPQNGYEEIIVDEAQDVELLTYDILNSYSKSISYTTDDNQILYPENCSKKIDLQNKFKNREFTLHTNFRNTKEISRFVRTVFPDQVRQDGIRNGQKPQLINIGNDDVKQINAIIGIINNFPEATHNIVILAPYQSNVQSIYTSLQNKGITCTMFSSEQQVLNTIGRVHVTTFKSCKGLEFDTVIIPNIHSFDFWKNGNVNIVNDEDLYVVFTRSKSNIFLLNNSNPYYESKNLAFLQNAIKHGTLEQEDYVAEIRTNIAPSKPTNSRNIIEDDDLPF
ncbi:AAA domain-containing protein [Cellulophaga baltica]|uniref:AAA domain-containing protein n=1 Tax=Cellulophaga baltica TaxID=76594 RepID=UPI000405911B|nr:AAA domain-containing protein [Cellulophaga baltica]